MPTLAAYLQHIDTELEAARTALQSARAAARHSPNADTTRAEARAEQRLNNLLDRRLRLTHAHAHTRG